MCTKTVCLLKSAKKSEIVHYPRASFTKKLFSNIRKKIEGFLSFNQLLWSFQPYIVRLKKRPTKPWCFIQHRLMSFDQCFEVLRHYSLTTLFLMLSVYLLAPPSVSKLELKTFIMKNWHSNLLLLRTTPAQIWKLRWVHPDDDKG